MSTVGTILRSLQGGRPSVWGDGFAGDDWVMIGAVRSWDELSADEYARFHPQLAAQTGRRPPPCLVDALADALAAWLWHGRQRPAGERPMCLTALSPDEAEHRGPPAHAALFGQNRRPIWPWQQDPVAVPEATATESAVAGLRLMDRTLTWCRSESEGDPPPAAGGLASFAYLSGLHPAYLWPDAAARHERDAAAAWLGIVARGRPAIMPADVADYLRDIIRVERGVGTVHDRDLAPLIRPWINPLRLATLAARRCRGTLDPIDRRMLARAGSVPLWRSLRLPPRGGGAWLSWGGTGAAADPVE